MNFLPADILLLDARSFESIWADSVLFMSGNPSRFVT